MTIEKGNLIISERAYYLTIAFLELAIIGFLIGFMGSVLFGGGFNTYAIGYVIWTLVVGFTPLINSFLVVIPKNSGAVIINTFRTYEKNPKPTKLVDTRSLREVGPGLQGVLLWERVGWIIDLGKQIVLKEPLETPSKDEILLTIDWQVILTPLPSKLVNLVRHEGETVKEYFNGLFRSKLIELVSQEMAQAIAAKKGSPETKSIYEKKGGLQTEFTNFLGGPEGIHAIEEEFGTFTNNPQLINIRRSTKFQGSVESLAINRNTAAAVENLASLKGLSSKQALIAVLASQGEVPEGLVDVSLNADVKGLKNLRTFVAGGLGALGIGEKTSGRRGKK